MKSEVWKIGGTTAPAGKSSSWATMVEGSIDMAPSPLVSGHSLAPAAKFRKLAEGISRAASPSLVRIRLGTWDLFPTRARVASDQAQSY